MASAYHALEDALKKSITGEVRFDAGSRALYSTDASNYRQVPIGVVVPKTKDDIFKTISLCRDFGAPILSRGAGTSLAGQCCNVAVVMDMSKYYNRILSIDAKNKTARVQPGVVLDTLRHQAEKYGLTFGPDPASHNRCTLGGMLGNNSCGVHALIAGKTVDNTQALEILTPGGQHLHVGATTEAELAERIEAGGRTGELYRKLRDLRDRYETLIRARYPKIPRRVSGYNLEELLPENGFNVARALVGTEGTCVTILEATLKLIENPMYRSLVVLGYSSVYEAADHTPELMKFKPIGLEGMDFEMVNNLRRYQGYHARIERLPEGQAWLLVEFGGASPLAVTHQAEAFLSAMRASGGSALTGMKRCQDAAETKDIWEIRESALAATAFIPGQRDRCEGWEDSAVEPAKLGAYLRDLRKLYESHNYRGAFYGHFGDGCVHTRIDFDLATPEGVRNFRAFLDDAADLVVRYGGSLSGEHGDGQGRGELLEKMYGPELVQAFREFKAIWDPQNKMNPGKVVNPYPITSNLRLGAEQWRPAHPQTHFVYPDDQNDFARVAIRCVGVGKCRRDGDGVMCPSYRATREEKHSTRGRAHLLFEMLQGDVIKDGWKSKEVKEALDLCLSCKGCKSDCPVNVDMASYKAEFLAHYYDKKMRPPAAYAFGQIQNWAPIAARSPALANFFAQTPGLSHLGKLATGMHWRRKIPLFAKETFEHWFKKRQTAWPSSPKPLPPKGGEGVGDGAHAVMLWADTFTNYFHPEVGQAATCVLESMGYRVTIPDQPVCCGRPLYDYGWLEKARAQVSRMLATFSVYTAGNIPIVALEPGCFSVLKDELVNFFPTDPGAKAVRDNSFLFGEFLAREGKIDSLPKVNQKALVQFHCHQKSVLSVKEDSAVMAALGLDVSAPEPSCCGMAGSFGFEASHYNVSMQCGERALLPAVRSANPDTLIIANGFSCREQISQGAGRRPLHLAEVLSQRLGLLGKI